jgi:glycerophosphoryl diester phosphodiesterase
MAGGAPENTIEAMELAFGYGADAVEFDLRLTADGEIVVHHDPIVDRTTDGKGEIARMTLAELRELNAGANFVAGSVETRIPPETESITGVPYPEYSRSPSSAGRRYRIPTFREVLDRFHDRNLLIEIKAPLAATGARKLIEEFGIQSSVLIDSYSTEALKVFEGSGIAAGSGREGVISLLAAYFTLRSSPVKFDALCIPPRYKGWPIPLGVLTRIARKRGKSVNVWTINRREEARALWKMGVSGIITDDVRPILEERSRLL